MGDWWDRPEREEPEKKLYRRWFPFYAAAEEWEATNKGLRFVRRSCLGGFEVETMEEPRFDSETHDGDSRRRIPVIPLDPDLIPERQEGAPHIGLSKNLKFARNDAYGFFEATGDLLFTGPTLTDVNDFRAILITCTEGDTR